MEVNRNDKTKKLLCTLVISIIIIVLGLFMYIKYNPPLWSPGVSSMRGNASNLVEIVNHGFADIYLEKVFVNNREKPVKVELGVSRTNHLVLGAGLDVDPYVTFHNIRVYEVKPELSAEKRKILEESKDRKVIKHYGLYISHDKPLKKIIIIYRYLGFKFRHEKDI